jgi:hypothetical protein
VTTDLDLHSAQALDRNRPVATDTDPYIAYVSISGQPNPNQIWTG